MASFGPSCDLLSFFVSYYWERLTILNHGLTFVVDRDFARRLLVVVSPEARAKCVNAGCNACVCYLREQVGSAALSGHNTVQAMGKRHRCLTDLDHLIVARELSGCNETPP